MWERVRRDLLSNSEYTYRHRGPRADITHLRLDPSHACNELGYHQLPNTILINFLQHASEHVAGMFADADRQQERTSIWRALADHLDKRSCVHLKVLVIAAAHEHTGGVRAVCGIKRVVSLCGDLQEA